MRDFLPSLVRDDVLDDVLRCGPRYFRPGGEPFIPLEFADGAYRYGHSQIRHTYQLNCDTAPVPMFPDLMGFGPTPAARRVDWALMFDVPGRPPAQRSKRMDGTLPRSLIRLPTAVVGDTERQYHSLAVRDLQRGQAVGLPSGEQVAVRMGIEPLTEEEVGLRQHGWGRETPLWFYVLREALAREKGNRLGEVGGRIVAEVLVGLVTSDPESYLAVDSDWRPTLPGSSPDTFGLVDLLSASTAAEPRTHEEVPE
jgi:hypothetical protein